MNLPIIFRMNKNNRIPITINIDVCRNKITIHERSIMITAEIILWLRSSMMCFQTYANNMRIIVKEIISAVTWFIAFIRMRELMELKARKNAKTFGKLLDKIRNKMTKHAPTKNGCK